MNTYCMECGSDDISNQLDHILKEKFCTRCIDGYDPKTGRAVYADDYYNDSIEWLEF